MLGGEGESGWEVCGGEVSDHSKMFLLQKIRGGENKGARQSEVIWRYRRHPNARIRLHKRTRRPESLSPIR